MKFEFEIKTFDDVSKVRAMLMRGYHAFQMLRIEMQQERSTLALGPPVDLEECFANAEERYAQEEKAWQELLVSFTKEQMEQIQVVDPDECSRCGSRNTNELDHEYHECYDCGRTYKVRK